MKKSYISILLLTIVGLLPLGAGLYQTVSTPMEEAPAAMPLPTETITADQQYSFVEETVTLASQTTEMMPKESSITATVGAINTAVMAWLTFFLRRREKVMEKIKKLELAAGDLALMPTLELFGLIWRSTHSWHEFKRFLLRSNAHYSIYGFSHVALLPKVAARPIQYIDRGVKSPNWILEHFEPGISSNDWIGKERSLTTIVRAWKNPRAESVSFMQDDGETTRVDYGLWLDLDNWRTDPQRSANPQHLAESLEANEIAIMMFFNKDGEDEIFTLIGTDTHMPETLEQWEDFIMAYLDENRLMVKNSILVSVVALHLPIA